MLNGGSHPSLQELLTLYRQVLEILLGGKIAYDGHNRLNTAF